MKKTSRLVFQHLEKISGDVFEDYQELIRHYVHDKSGLYALYRNNKLYYVGLARNLNGRLKQHLRDRHVGLWDRFSVFLTSGERHLREIEALVLRIASPEGNIQKGKIGRSVDLRRQLSADIKEVDECKRERIFTTERKASVHQKRQKQKVKTDKDRISSLAKYTKEWLWLKMTYKGNVYRAHLRKDGTIKFDQKSHRYSKLKNKIFYSPSAAGHAVTKKPNDGWKWWYFKRGEKWILLDELRK